VHSVSSRNGTRSKGGLTVPSCIKYVHYFVHVLNFKIEGDFICINYFKLCK